ncbi:hypothetical protein FRB90_002103 [Tulasnella sp. 427]|nr:hypothetical protein FRB90_002103 [Tulasnella sp. 427]
MDDPRVTRDELARALTTFARSYAQTASAHGWNAEETVRARRTTERLLALCDGIEALMSQRDEEEAEEDEVDQEMEGVDAMDLDQGGGSGSSGVPGDGFGGVASEKSVPGARITRCVPVAAGESVADRVKGKAKSTGPVKGKSVGSGTKVSIPSLGTSRRGGNWAMVASNDNITTPANIVNDAAGGIRRAAPLSPALAARGTLGGGQQQPVEQVRAGGRENSSSNSADFTKPVVREKLLEFRRHVEACVSGSVDSETLANFVEWIGEDEQSAERASFGSWFFLASGGRAISKPNDLDKTGFVQKHLKKVGREAMERSGIPVPEWL